MTWQMDRWDIAAERAAQYDAVSCGDAGTSRRREVGSTPDLGGGRANGSLAGQTLKATVFRIHPELGGIVS